MTDKFQIDLRHQIKSYEKGLITFGLAFVGVLGFGYFDTFNLRDLSTYTSFIFTCLLFSLPAIYLHISYFIENHGKVMVVDWKEKKLTIMAQGQNFNYVFEDIENAELNLGIYFKNQLDNQLRYPAPWTNYGYLKLKFRDGREFILTSLMADLQKLSLPVTATKFRLHPFLKR
ncbi:MAG: hypothetical protein O9294_01540 [Cytophagales bacterium]|jgi:hypothetical protein|nr:hypothetical protein [Cytophagales bacterium]